MICASGEMRSSQVTSFDLEPNWVTTFDKFVLMHLSSKVPVPSADLDTMCRPLRSFLTCHIGLSQVARYIGSAISMSIVMKPESGNDTCKYRRNVEETISSVGEVDGDKGMCNKVVIPTPKYS